MRWVIKEISGVPQLVLDTSKDVLRRISLYFIFAQTMNATLSRLFTPAIVFGTLWIPGRTTMLS